ncbi:PREDICTED: male-specific lethal 1 homolog [Amphimedon queenslandica]|uniref:PEHE domain-containing protein n=1 Tax=Amphimedon queenslandica TaxID=400682 RepID=A0A1X7VUA1_AMPQE|nr:PREDICTED: male-specific lethal 1 homolog [Amphimedon queenslandica]|eukprot:XP_011403324.1 PREDICTED: male-specific lethal 1 homolog [Amphimedon queenslandica]
MTQHVVSGPTTTQGGPNLRSNQKWLPLQPGASWLFESVSTPYLDFSFHMREGRQVFLSSVMSERDPDKPNASDNSCPSKAVPSGPGSLEEPPTEPPHISLLLSSRDLLYPYSGPTETEKAVLVLKEHSYASLPQFTQLAPFLHRLASSIEGKEEEERNKNSETPFNNISASISTHSSQYSSSKARSLLRNVRQTLSDTRRSLLLDGGRDQSGGIDREKAQASSSHFREMISLQSMMIHELQEQVQLKDAESNMILREKEQLKARLERMERRLSILQKHSHDKTEAASGETISSPSTPTSSRTHRIKPDSVTRLTRSETSSSHSRKSRSRSSSIEPITSRRASKLSGSAPTTNSLAVMSHRAHGKREQEEEDEDLQQGSKKLRLSSIDKPNSFVRTSIMYDGLNLEEKTIINDIIVEGKIQERSLPDIKVPTWSLSKSDWSSKGGEGDTDLASVEEDTSDDSFLKRHHKLEADEKRRKRWDAQRLREQYQHNQLMKRYMQKEGMPQTQEKKKEKLTSLQPKLEDLEGIELAETVVVSGFGRPLPKVPPSTFRLANFNPHSAAGKGRNKTRTRSSSGGSLAASNNNNSMYEDSNVT